MSERAIGVAEGSIRWHGHWQIVRQGGWVSIILDEQKPNYEIKVDFK